MASGNDNQQSARESQELIELAVKSRFITAQQEQEILPRLFEYSEDRSARTAARFLVENKILSKEKIETLFAIKNHLQTLMADKTFGKIGVANDFVSEKNVQKALDIQVSIFRKRKKSVKIGDILVNNNDMKVEDQTAVLLTQDRIKDECLEEAMDTIAASEMERMEINRRFGAIAVKKGLITTKQLNRALKHQEKLEEEGEKRYLGEVLKEMFGISEKDVSDILKIQKKIEVKRMNLEENLGHFGAEKKMNLTLDSYFEYIVSDDRLKAYVRRVKKEEKSLDPDAFLNWLAQAGITYGLCSKEDISAFLETEKIGAQLLVAEGLSPENGSGSTRFYFDTSETPEIPQLVKEGEILARYTPPGKMASGTDVFGRPVAAMEDQTGFLICGEGVRQKGEEYLASKEGYPRLYDERTIFVIPAEQETAVKKIQGDVVSDIQEPELTLEIEGSITPEAHVFCSRLVVKGDILGKATVSGDITVTGHIGSDTHHARVDAKGVVHVGRNIQGAVIVGEKGINAPKSDIISSRATSYCDIVAQNIISSQNAPSILWVGREVVLRSAQIDHEIQVAECELDEIMFKDELDGLSDELLEKVQVQNGYLEKQNVTQFLNRVFQDPQYDGIEDVFEKINRFEDDPENSPAEGETIVSQNPKNHKFINAICEKIQNLTPTNQKKYIQELHDSISGMYKAAVRETERVNKRYKARSEAIDIQIEDLKPKIEEKKKLIESLMAKKDFLRLRQEDDFACPNPVIKIKNQISRYTIVKGERTKLVIDKNIHGVTLEETNKDSDADAKIIVEGYFE